MGDRRRSRQRTATIGVFGFATVQSVRNALAGIERARLSDERLAVWSPSCGSRRERFASRRVGECVSLMCHCVRHIGLDNKHGRSVEAIHSFLSRWKACTELCAGTQKSRAAREELDGERELPEVLTQVSEVRLDADFRNLGEHA